MNYTILYARAFQRSSVQKISKADRLRIHDAIIHKLQTHPNVFGKPLRQSLRGFWSLRVGPYRVIYRIEKTSVNIFEIGKRDDVYD